MRIGEERVASLREDGPWRECRDVSLLSGEKSWRDARKMRSPRPAIRAYYVTRGAGVLQLMLALVESSSESYPA
jgi:hypothetical protein